MFRSTLNRLACPKRKCWGEIALEGEDLVRGDDVLQGTLSCRKCRAKYPILAGIAVLVEDVRDYLLSHAKGVMKLVPDERIPAPIRRDFLEIREEIESEGAQHIEEDLEAGRVTALYLMTHFLDTKGEKWWRPIEGPFSPVLDEIIAKHWDHGPFAKILEWKDTRSLDGSWIEIGCGVGGLGRRLGVKSYLGVDSSFASIALARHVVLGAPYPEKLTIPGDLIQGQLPKPFPVSAATSALPGVDYVVGEAQNLPARHGAFDVAASLNMIDMLEVPADLPRAQRELLRPEGTAIQSCPYIWHPEVARQLRKQLKQPRTSSAAVEALYQKEGFRLEASLPDVPWLFFKHQRQLEIYSVHMMLARLS